MKKLLLLLLLIGLSFATSAQDTASCTAAAQEASSLITAAQDLLASGQILEASTLLDSANLLLADCGATVPMPTAASNATLAPTTAANESTAPNASSNFTLTAPTVIAENSIAFVRFAHTSVDVGALDIYMGNSNVLVVSNLLFGDFTEFIPINGGEISFLARRHDAGADSEVLSQLSWNFVGNSSWIVSAVGIVETLAFELEPISVTRNEYNEQARLRIVNLLADAPRLTVNADNGLVLANGLGWIGLQDTLLDAGSYHLQVSTTSDAAAPEALSFDFEANLTYTLYVIGGREQAIEVLNIASPADMTQVQFINQTSTALDIHYRPSNLRFVENLSAGSSSAWLSLASGAYTFISYAPNTGPTGQELAGISIQLRPQRHMVFEILGSEIRLVSESITETAD